MRTQTICFVFISFLPLLTTFAQESATSRPEVLEIIRQVPQSKASQSFPLAWRLLNEPAFRYSVSRCDTSLSPPAVKGCTQLQMPRDLNLTPVSVACPRTSLLNSTFADNTDQLPRTCIIAALQSSTLLGESPCGPPGSIKGKVCNDNNYVDLVYQSYTSILKCAQSLYPEAKSVLSERTLFGKIVNESGFQLTAYAPGAGYGIAQFTRDGDNVNVDEPGKPYRFNFVKNRMLQSQDPYCKYATRFLNSARPFDTAGCLKKNCNSCGVYEYPSNPAASFVAMVALTLENFHDYVNSSDNLGAQIQRACRRAPVSIRTSFCNKLKDNLTMLAYNMGYGGAERALTSFLKSSPLILTHKNFEVYLAEGARLATRSSLGTTTLPANQNFSQFLVEMEKSGEGGGTPSYLSQAFTKLTAAENKVGGVGSCGNRSFFVR